MVERIHPRVPCLQTQDCHRTVYVQTDGRSERVIFEVVKASCVVETANILSGRFLTTFTKARTRNVQFKAQFVVQECRDRDKTIFVLN